MNAIETIGLTKIYHGKTVVDKVDMAVPEGSIFGFVGENGAGKTTIMRMIAGLAEPSKGSYKLFDVANTDKRIYSIRNQTSAIVETTSLVPTMTAQENLKFACLYLGIKETPDFDELLKKVGLCDVGGKKVKNFSLGMRQRLGIALALLNNPTMMMLDEPMNGLDPQGIAELRELLVGLNKEHGMTILISSHILSELEKIATHYGIISHGKLLKTITVEELEDSCKKSVDIKVDDMEKALKALENLGLKDYKDVGGNTIKVFDEIKIAPLVIGLSKENVDILKVESRDETIEEFYLNLIGEGK